MPPSAADIELVRSLQPVSGVDLVALFREEGAWAAFADTASSAFEPDFICRGVGTPQGELDGRGLDGLRRLWTDWLSPWDSYVADVEDVRAVGDSVVVLVRDHGTTGGFEVDELAASVWWLRDGRVHLVEFHVDREAALRVAAA